VKLTVRFLISESHRPPYGYHTEWRIYPKHLTSAYHSSTKVIPGLSSPSICRQACDKEGTFVCRSFAYIHPTKACHLSRYLSTSDLIPTVVHPDVTTGEQFYTRMCEINYFCSIIFVTFNPVATWRCLPKTMPGSEANKSMVAAQPALPGRLTPHSGEYQH
jgi:hypothetical protein